MTLTLDLGEGKRLSRGDSLVEKKASASKPVVCHVNGRVVARKLHSHGPVLQI